METKILIGVHNWLFNGMPYILRFKNCWTYEWMCIPTRCIESGKHNARAMTQIQINIKAAVRKAVRARMHF